MPCCGNDPKCVDECRLSGRGGLVAVSGSVTAVPAWSAESATAVPIVHTPLFAVVVGLLTLILLSALLLLWRTHTRARQQAQRIQERLAQYENMTGNLPIGLHEVVEEEGCGPRFVYINDRALELMGVSRRQAENDLYTAFSNVHPDDREAVLQTHEAAREQNTPLMIEARFLVEGRQRWLRIESWPREVNGRLSWPGCTTDVTDRREAELQFRVLFEQSPLSIILHDPETGALLDANRAAWGAYGLNSLEELRQRNLWSNPPYSQADALALIRQAAEGRAQRFEWCSMDVHGQPFWELVSLMPVIIGGRRRVLSSAVDISELRAYQQRLAERESLLSAMSELAAVGGWAVDLRSGELQWTEQTYRLHDLPLDTDLSVTDALAFYSPEDRSLLEQAIARAQAAGKPYDLTLPITTASGHERLVRSICRPVEQDGKVVQLIGAVQDVTDLVEAERRFRAIFEQSPVMTLIHDAETGEVLDANRQAWLGWGYDSVESLQAARPHTAIGPEYCEEQTLERVRQAARRGRDRFEWPSRHADGHVMWHDVTLTPIQLSGRACVLAVCLDITERRAAEHRLRESEARFRHILQDVDGVSVQGYDADGQVRYWNRASEELYGYSAAEAVGSNLLDLIIPPEMREDVRENLERMLEGGGIENGEMELMRKDGSRVPVYSSHTVLRRPDGAPELFCVDIDLSERKAHEDALDRMAHYDPLTGLPNRRLMAGMLEQMMARARRAQSSFALCYLDLDDFKPINDAMGHEIGDRVLVEVGQRLRRLIRGSDLVARLGGDEFVLALDGVGDGPELGKRLRFILDGISRPIELDGRHFQVRGSIGVTLYPQDDADPDTLLRHADQAMYRAKAMGRNQFSLFDTEIEARVSEQRERLRELEAGLDQGQFRLHFQPKIKLSSGQVEGFEGLVRWHHPESGVLAPARFLPALDSTGLEARFGDHVIEQALQQLQQWLQGGLDLSLSVNISGPHLLSEGFVDRLQGLLGRYPDVVPARLGLEIVESAAVTDLQRAVAVLLAVRRLGLQTSLDDFGTGYSSLSHLRSLPVDEVKIDQSFVRDMLTDLNDYNIVRSVIGLADAFGLRVVAEGVETPEHADALGNLGCEIVQGYAIACPMPAEEVIDWLSEHSSTSS